MTHEDIIRMAREAGIGPVYGYESIERFATLVAAEKEKRIIDILERLQERNESHNYYAYAINVIRARI